MKGFLSPNYMPPTRPLTGPAKLYRFAKPGETWSLYPTSSWLSRKNSREFRE
jgi:hypothetical protein